MTATILRFGFATSKGDPVSRWVALAAISALVGCAQGGGARRDAGLAAPDVGSTDATSSDAARLSDVLGGAAPDAFEAVDAIGPLGDSSSSDAAHFDVFATLDASSPDAASPDAFSRFDAFARDAFARDAFAAPDAASGCSESPCRLVPPQCGCAAGQSCYPSGTMRVCAATGSRLEGDGCSGVSDCRMGLACVNFSASTTMPGNMCARMCSTDADCESGALCLHTISDGAGGSVPGLELCTRNCTPAPHSGCAPGLACGLFQESGGMRRVFTDCSGPVGTGRQGATCTDDTDCAAGYGCFTTVGTRRECLQWCRVASPSCPFGTTCIGVAIVRGVEWGACA